MPRVLLIDDTPEIAELLTYSRSDLHYSKHPPTPAHYYAIWADVAGMSILAWCCIALSRRVQGRAGVHRVDLRRGADRQATTVGVTQWVF